MAHEHENRHPRKSLLKAIREHYHPPGPAPRAEIWAAIEAELEAGPAVAPGSGARGNPEPGAWRQAAIPRRVFIPSLAAAAVLFLLLGIGIGRTTAPGSGDRAGRIAGDPSAAADASAQTDDPDGVVQGDDSSSLSTFTHLQEADFLLSILIDEGSDPWVRGHAARWANSLILETRLLREVYAGRETDLEGLLRELEHTLVQVTALDEAADGEEGLEAVRSIALALDRQRLLLRIHDVLPRLAS